MKCLNVAVDDKTRDRKIALGATWLNVLKAGVIALEKGEVPKKPKKEKEVKKAVPRMFLLDKDVNVVLREFDLLKENAWVTVDYFNQIPIGGTFRVRDDARVVALPLPNDPDKYFKEWKKLSHPVVKRNENWVEVEAIC